MLPVCINDTSKVQFPGTCLCIFDKITPKQLKSIKCVLKVKGRGEGAVECLRSGERALDVLVPSPLLLALILSYNPWSGQLSEDSSR